MHDEFTQLLHAWRAGDLGARDRLFEQVYQTLHGMAVARMRRADGATLRPTVLVHDAMLRMIDGGAHPVDRAHFLALAALKMRAVLVDHARARHAAKRGGGDASLTLSHAESLIGTHAETARIDVLALHQALEELAARDPRAAQSVEMAYFSGMSQSEIATVLEVSLPTIERDLRFARAWLNRRLS